MKIKKYSLIELAGILTNKEAEYLRNYIKERRKTIRLRISNLMLKK